MMLRTLVVLWSSAHALQEQKQRQHLHAFSRNTTAFLRKRWSTLLHATDEVHHPFHGPDDHHDHDNVQHPVNNSEEAYESNSRVARFFGQNLPLISGLGGSVTGVILGGAVGNQLGQPQVGVAVGGLVGGFVGYLCSYVYGGLAVLQPTPDSLAGGLGGEGVDQSMDLAEPVFEKLRIMSLSAIAFAEHARHKDGVVAAEETAYRQDIALALGSVKHIMQCEFGGRHDCAEDLHILEELLTHAENEAYITAEVLVRLPERLQV